MRAPLTTLHGALHAAPSPPLLGLTSSALLLVPPVPLPFQLSLSRIAFQVLLIVVLARPAASASGLIPSATNGVLALTQSNWATQGPPGHPSETYLVKFFAPWCGHCKKLYPTWDALAAELSEVRVAKVDMTAGGRSLGQEYGVRGFPTIFKIKGEEYERHQGDRDIDSLRDFAQRPIGSDGKAEMLPQGTARIIHKFVIYLHAGMATIEATATRLGPFKFALVSSCCMLGLLFFGFMLGYTCRKYRKYEYVPLDLVLSKDTPTIKLGMMVLDATWTVKSPLELGADKRTPGCFLAKKSDVTVRYNIPPVMHLSTSSDKPTDKKEI